MKRSLVSSRSPYPAAAFNSPGGLEIGVPCESILTAAHVCTPHSKEDCTVCTLLSSKGEEAAQEAAREEEGLAWSSSLL